MSPCFCVTNKKCWGGASTLVKIDDIGLSCRPLALDITISRVDRSSSFDGLLGQGGFVVRHR